MSNSDRQSEQSMHDCEHVSFWRTRSGLVFCGFLVIAAFFLITEHSAHVALAVPYLPWLLILACPLMHLFMHGGHHGHGGGPTHGRDGRD
jgi:hypothetical protein